MRPSEDPASELDLLSAPDESEWAYEEPSDSDMRPDSSLIPSATLLPKAQHNLYGRYQRSTSLLESFSRYRRSCKPGWQRRVFLRFLFLVLGICGLVHFLHSIIGIWPLGGSSTTQDLFLDLINHDRDEDGIHNYTGDFTRDVIPIPCHSHNDYWRRVPLYEAIHYGCTSVEADVWLFDNDLFVGHNAVSLSKNRTFRTLYVDRIEQILDTRTSSVAKDDAEPIGIFDVDPKQSLILLVDFKTGGQDTYNAVYNQLESLRAKNYLTFFNGSAVISRQVTVVASGDAPFELITANKTHRDIFFDAPLHDLSKQPLESGDVSESHPTSEENLQFDATTSFYASTSFGRHIGTIWLGSLSKKQLQLISDLVAGAHQRGLKARFWDTPSWPVSRRNYVWDVLMKEGADYLNVDDLRAAAKLDWTAR